MTFVSSRRRKLPLCSVIAVAGTAVVVAGRGKISAAASGDASGTLCTGIYRGPGKPERVR